MNQSELKNTITEMKKILQRESTLINEYGRMDQIPEKQNSHNHLIRTAKRKKELKKQTQFKGPLGQHQEY